MPATSPAPTEPLDHRKRLFVKTSLAGLASVAIGACGGDGNTDGAGAGSGSPGDTLDGGSSEVELVTELEPLTPSPSAFDLAIDPRQLVEGVTELRVIQDGLPVAGAPVEVRGADGQLYFAGTTNADGELRWTGRRTAGIHAVAQGPKGQLSLYELDFPEYSLGSMALTVVSTLADRVRLTRQWLPSQAEQRVQQFLWISPETPLCIDFNDTLEFSHAVFAEAQARSGLSQHAYLDRLAAQASADDYALHAIDMAPAAADAGKALSDLPISPGAVVGFIATTARDMLSLKLTDEQKLDLFGGLFWKTGLLNTVAARLAALSAQMDTIKTMLSNILQALSVDAISKAQVKLHQLDDAYTAIVRIQTSGATDASKRQQVLNLVREHKLSRGALPLEALKEFLGGFSSTFDANSAAYPLMFRHYHSMVPAAGDFQLNLDATKGQNKRFFSRDAASFCATALEQVQVLVVFGMTWALVERVAVLEDQRAQQAANPGAPSAGLSEQSLWADIRVAATELLACHQLLAALRPAPLPHPFVYLNVEDSVAWFNDPATVLDTTRFYGSWHGDWASWQQYTGTKPRSAGKRIYGYNLRHAHRLLPAEVQAMCAQVWGPPTRAQMDSTFFRPVKLGKYASVEQYARATGAPQNGVFTINDKSKPKFHVWLADVEKRGNPEWIRRYYGRMYDQSFNYVTGICYVNESGQAYRAVLEDCEFYPGESPAGSRVRYVTNYEDDTAYYYPANASVINPAQYYPWAQYKAVRDKTNSFNYAEIVRHYGK